MASPVKLDGISMALAVTFPPIVCAASAAGNYRNFENSQATLSMLNAIASVRQAYSVCFMFVECSGQVQPY